MLTEELLDQVVRPGQYLGNEWGAARKNFELAHVRLALAFPDLYELGMSNFGLKILYQIVNQKNHFMADRTYAPGSDLEALLRERQLPLWGWESRRPLSTFELVGFSLQYELTYTNVLNMLDLAHIPVLSKDRTALFPLIFGGGPSSVNPEPMAPFLDFFIIGDGEKVVPSVMELIRSVLETDQQRSEAWREAEATTEGVAGADLMRCHAERSVERAEEARSGGNEEAEGANAAGADLKRIEADLALMTDQLNKSHLLLRLQTEIEGIYVPRFYQYDEAHPPAKPITISNKSAEEARDEADGAPIKRIPERVLRQVVPLTDENQPTKGIVPYLSLVHDRQVLEVRRGCDRGCRFCQPGYTFLPVRERSASDLLRLSTDALSNSGHDEYSLLSLCVSDYTSLHESVRALNEEHGKRRTSLSFPSQRADRMNFDLAEELKVVRKSGITLAPEAGTERLRAVINKGLSHKQIISAIEAAFESGWTAVKLYFMCGLPTETDEDLKGIVDLLKEATNHCRVIRQLNPLKYRRNIEFTCTISNFVPKPFTPFQWFGQTSVVEMDRKHKVLKSFLKEARLNNVTLHFTNPQISLLECVISRGDRPVGDLIYGAWKSGATFDAWHEKFRPELWHNIAKEHNVDLEDLACRQRQIGSPQPWDVVHVGLNNWWLTQEWEKAMSQLETAACSENVCHACGICTELDATHLLSSPKTEVLKRNPFVKELAGHNDNDHHPSLFFTRPQSPPKGDVLSKVRFEFKKLHELRFISHLDLQHLLARAARRAKLNIAYSQGFNPSPKLSLASPLPIFQESEAEIGETELAQEITAEAFVACMNRELPEEVRLVRARLVFDNTPPLAVKLASALYRAIGRVKGGDEISAVEKLNCNIRHILENETLEIVLDEKQPQHKSNNGASDEPARRDIKAGLISLQISSDAPSIDFEIAQGLKMHVKPSELLSFFDTCFSWRVKRLELKAQDGTPLYSS